MGKIEVFAEACHDQNSIKELKGSAIKWYEAKKNKSGLEDFYDGAFMGASSALKWAGIVTDEELKAIEADTQEA